MQPRFHGLRANAEMRSRFIDAHFLDISHNEYEPERIRKVVDGLFEQPANLSPRCFSFGVVARRSCGEMGNPSLPIGCGHLAELDQPSPPANPTESFVHRDTREPSGEAGLATELIQV